MHFATAVLAISGECGGASGANKDGGTIDLDLLGNRAF